MLLQIVCTNIKHSNWLNYIFFSWESMTLHIPLIQPQFLCNLSLFLTFGFWQMGSVRLNSRDPWCYHPQPSSALCCWELLPWSRVTEAAVILTITAAVGWLCSFKCWWAESAVSAEQQVHLPLKLLLQEHWLWREKRGMDRWGDNAFRHTYWSVRAPGSFSQHPSTASTQENFLFQ